MYKRKTRRRPRNLDYLIRVLDMGLEADSPCKLWPYGANGSGYGTVWMRGADRQANRVVLALASGRDEPGLEAAHDRGGRSCVSRRCVNPAHLRWATRQENQRDRALHGTSNRGERAGRSRLTEADVRRIRGDDRPHGDIAAEHGVDRSHICRIKSGEAWAHVPMEAAP